MDNDLVVCIYDLSRGSVQVAEFFVLRKGMARFVSTVY